METSTSECKKRQKHCKNRTWSYKEEESLIEQWGNYECLFNIVSADYKRHDKRTAALDSIRDRLNDISQPAEPFTNDDIKSKMRNLRTQYGKENGKVKSSKASGASSGDVYTPSWKWFTLLEFLRDSISPVKTKPTPGVPSVIIDETDENFDLQNAGVTDNQPDPAVHVGKIGPDAEKESASVLVTNKLSKPNRKKSQENLENEVLNKSLVLLENITSKSHVPSVADDGDELFGQLVAQSLKGIENKRFKEMAKLKIQQFLFEAQFGSYDNMQSVFQPHQYMEPASCNSTYYH